MRLTVQQSDFWWHLFLSDEKKYFCKAVQRLSYVDGVDGACLLAALSVCVASPRPRDQAITLLQRPLPFILQRNKPPKLPISHPLPCTKGALWKSPSPLCVLGVVARGESSIQLMFCSLEEMHYVRAFSWALHVVNIVAIYSTHCNRF